jgi:hypothetical protein
LRSSVGQDDIDDAGDRVGFHVFGPVHRRRAEQVGGAPRLDEHIGLAGEAVRRGQRSLPPDQRQPGQAPVVGEPGDGERAPIQQIAVGIAALRIEAAVGDEPVEILEGRVVARIYDDAAVPVDDGGGALVPETTERRPLHRHRPGIVRICATGTTRRFA